MDFASSSARLVRLLFMPRKGAERLSCVRAPGMDQSELGKIATEADDTLSDVIDRAYRAKYRHYAANIVKSVLTPQARSATLRLVPRESARSTSRAPSRSRRP